MQEKRPSSRDDGGAHPPTGSGHLLTHSQSPDISNQRQINHRGLSPLGPAHSAPPHSSPACCLRKCPSGIPAVRGRVMTRLRRDPQPARPPVPAGATGKPSHQPGAQAPLGLPERRALMPDTRTGPSLNGFLFSAPEKRRGRGESLQPPFPAKVNKEGHLWLPGGLLGR